jgi:DNA helicase-2/ATP-dependent DNA helicase PcrA
MKSVRETDRYAGHFARALREVGISPYNPRSRTYLENEEITGILGAFISIIDPELNALRSIRGEGIDDIVRTWIQSYEDLASDYPNLADYVNLSKRNISRMDTDKWLDATILDMFYHMLSYEPFSEWKNDYERSYRLGKMSKLFEAYSSIPYPTTLGSNRGKLKISSTNRGEISFRWRQNFYYSLVGLLVSEGINDPEDEDIISPANRLPIMTVHQAKGLQFDFVFVYGLSNEPHPGSTIKLEKELSQFRKNSSSAIRFNEVQKAEQDLVRFYFVAYSRPKYALIHLVPKAHINNDKVGFINKSVRTFRDAVRNLGG